MGDEYRYREIFAPDCGALLDIYVLEITPIHWQVLLDFLSAKYELVYLEDGVEETLPDFATIWKRHNEKAVTLKVVLPGFTVNSHFFLEHDIELDLLPEDIDSFEKAKAVFELIRGIARQLHKEVLLVGETSITDPEELRRMATCSCDPTTGAIRILPGK
ncbi:MAG TPA: hypothetical protein VGK21_17495 [Candidatus Angelobacter sp.]|jgi:hypothetical protein